LILVIFIENAFKHVSRSHNEKGFIDIKFVQKGKEIKFTIKNSKSGKPGKVKSTGIGLENVRNRHDLFFPHQYTLSIEDTDTTYTSYLIINM